MSRNSIYDGYFVAFIKKISKKREYKFESKNYYEKNTNKKYKKYE